MNASFNFINHTLNSKYMKENSTGFFRLFFRLSANERSIDPITHRIMRFFIIGFFFLVSSLGCFSQGTSINTTGAGPAASAGLDVDFTNKGMLVPRMTQAQRNAISLPAASLLIYQTDNTPGYYYNSGTSDTPAWSRLITSASTGWLISGNSGTTASTNFIGTTDAQDLVLKTNNTERIRILSGGNVGIGTISPGYTLSFDNTAARTISPNRNTSAGAAGSNFLLGGGFGATSGAANQNGGDLFLRSGISTGTGSSNIYFQTAIGGSSGTADNTLFNIAQLYPESSTKSDFKLYSPNGSKFTQVGTDQLWNTGSVYTTATSLELWSNANKVLVLDGSQNGLFAGNVGIRTTSPNSTLQINGSVSAKTNTVSSDYTIGSTDYFIKVATGDVDRTLTLPTAASSTGRIYVIKKVDSGTGHVVITATGFDLIDATTTFSITAPFSALSVISDGTGWFIMTR